MKRFLSIFILISTAGFSQTFVYPKNYFHSPVDIPLKLAGNFGELRPNHFHTGIDITTSGVEGVPVKAAADGYVSRIKIGPWGYGHVIYITHPNGFTTVYGHLSDFNSIIAAYVKKNQYINESFEIELTPAANEIPVKQDQVVAYSGNTGSSGGPHLHFEIRDSKTEEAINPMLFGLPIKDNVAPTLQTLIIIPSTPQSLVNGKNEIKKIPLKQSGSTYVFVNATDSAITIIGKVGFAIEAYDKETIANGKNGVYAIKLQCDKKTIYSHKLERIPFDKSRFINCFIDYEEMEERNHFYQQSFLLPNNELPIYDSVVNNGFCYFNSDSIHKFKYIVSDVYGNTATLNFKVRSEVQLTNGDLVFSSSFKPFQMVLLWDTTNLIDESAFRLETPSRAFYDKTIFNFTVLESKVRKYSPKIQFDKKIGLQLPCSLTVYGTVPEELQSKAFLVNDGSYVGGKWMGKGVSAEIKEFGTFYISIDTTAPIITALNAGTNFSALKQIGFTISDNLSGIENYRATVDGKWILMEYEPKKKLLFYKFDEHVTKGNHELVLTVTDKVGNKTELKKNFVR
jgi:murein DD-endopeptidase MepM/ murein hydrolase activator NlpD